MGNITRQRNVVSLYAALLGVTLLAVPAVLQSYQGDHLKLQGDVILGGLFPVHRRSTTTENNCSHLDHNPGYQFMASMLFALEEINNDPSILPNITLGAEIYDTCRSQTIGVDSAKELIRYTLSKSNETSPLVAVIGAFRSDVSMAVANILRVFDIPQVSYGSSSPDLSNKDIYSYFFRTVPSDSFQAKAMVDVVMTFGWTYVLTVYSSGRYAEKGMEWFYEEAKRVKLCIASKIKLPDFPTEEDYKDVIRKLVQTRKTTDKGHVDVVVLFCIQRDNEGLLRAAKHVLQGEERFTWVAANTWGDRDVAKGSEEIGAGALTTSYLGGEVQRFKNYFLSRNLSNEHGKWFEEFWQEVVNCDLSEGSSNTSRIRRKCLDSDNIPRNYPIAPVRLVINAVYAVAHALDDMRKDACTTGSGLCSNMRKIKGKDMLRYLRNVTFPDASYNIPLRFNEKQEVDGNYTVLNFRKIKGQYRAIQVGVWDGVLTKDERIEGSLVINKSSVVWGGVEQNVVPESYCSSKCKNKQIQIHDRTHPWCCWHCMDCDAHSIVTNNSCKPCLKGYRPVDDSKRCKKLPIVYPSLKDPAAIVLTFFTSIGLLVTIATAAFFVVNRSHLVIKAAGKELCTILFAGVLSCHVAALLYFVKPNAAVCTVLRFAGTVPMTVCYAPVFLRTNRIYRIFKSAKSSVTRPSFTSRKSQIMAACGMIGVQVSITLVWILAEPPTVVRNYQHDDGTLLTCNSDNKTLAVSLSYNAALMLISTVYAFKTRAFPRNFNEAKYIAITMYVSCSVWVIFVPCYLNAKDSIWKDYFASGALLLIGVTTLLGLLVPKVYLVASGNGSQRKESTFASIEGPGSTNAADSVHSTEGVTIQPHDVHEMMHKL